MIQSKARATAIFAVAMMVTACGSGGGDAQGGTGSTTAAPTFKPGEVTLAIGALTGDAARGQRVFARCAACHSINAGQNSIGPSLHGVVGRPAGTAPGFGYSPAIKTSGKTWTKEAIFAFLEAPPMNVPGTRMMFVLTDPQDRADVITYLSTVK